MFPRRACPCDVVFPLDSCFTLLCFCALFGSSALQTRLLRYCAQEGICVTGFSPLGAGSYTEIGMAEASESAMLEPVVKAAAEAHSVSPAQVLLRWAVQRGTSAVAKSTKAERLAANIDVFSFSLTEEEMAAVTALNKNRRFNDPGFFCEAAFNTFCPIYD